MYVAAWRTNGCSRSSSYGSQFRGKESLHERKIDIYFASKQSTVDPTEGPLHCCQILRVRSSVVRAPCVNLLVFLTWYVGSISSVSSAIMYGGLPLSSQIGSKYQHDGSV